MASDSEAPSPAPQHRRLRRLGFGLLTLIVALGGFVLVLLFFESRDNSQVHDSQAATGPGQLVPDQRRARAPAAIRSDPDGMQLTDDQTLHALELGDVVLLYGTRTPPAALRAIQQRLSGAFDPVLAANGAAVILARKPGTDGVVALAWRRRLQAPNPADPAVASFADYWLGRGAGSATG